MPVGSDDDPDFDVVYRFRKQTLDFGLSENEEHLSRTVDLPDFTSFADRLTLRADLFSGSASSPLLFRTLLAGGSIVAEGESIYDWSLDTRYNARAGAPLTGPFPSDVLWTRTVSDRESLMLTLSDFAGKPDAHVPLFPVAGKIRLQIANLCASNPLEWKHLMLRQVSAAEDSDFKWFYTLFEPSDGDWPELLRGHVLPAPINITSPPQLHGTGSGGCVKAAKSGVNFPLRSDWTKTG